MDTKSYTFYAYHWESLWQKKSQPLKEVNFERIQIQKGFLSNVVCYQRSSISFDTKKRPSNVMCYQSGLIYPFFWSACFKSTLHWKGRSFVSQLI